MAAADRGVEGLTGAECRRHDLLELAVGYGLILLTVWTPRPWQRLGYFAALSWLVLAIGSSRDDLKAMGLRLSGSLRSFWLVGVALLVALGVAGLAVKMQTLHCAGGPAFFLQHYGGYAIFAFGQEFILLDFVLLRLLRLLPGPRVAVLAAAGMFALAHLPNPILMPATLLWGVAAGLLFLKYRNLYTLAVMHAIFGICLATTIPGPIHHNMRVGLGYIKYRPPVVEQHQRNQKDHRVSTVAWVIAEAPMRRP